MFNVRCKSEDEALAVRRVLLDYIGQSRFTVKAVWTQHKGRNWLVNIEQVRLDSSKSYCGNHAGPCQVTGHAGKHKKATFLEGMDWVSFNDMVNDALDAIGHDGDVGSPIVNIRMGRKRRGHYEGTDRPGEWAKFACVGHYADYCGEGGTQSTCENGTPGIRGWRKGSGESYE